MIQKDDKSIAWFENARLGLFIHWSLYAATEGIVDGKETKGIVEWIQSREQIPIKQYEKYAESLSADEFEPKSIAELASYAGMKYMVFTTKHHEGFAMYPTKYDDYSINGRCKVDRDVVCELVEAMREENIVPCFYYSQGVDFHEENAWGNTWDFDVPEPERDFRKYLDGKCKFQLKELLTEYGDIGLIWFDVPRGITPAIAAELRDYVKTLQPNCLVNGRLGGDESLWDYLCLGDNEAPGGRLNVCAETAATMNDTWGYKKNDKNFKTPETMIQLLCALISKGANLLLNIGPDSSGRIPQESVNILKALGDWMQRNGEAVYGTKASPFAADFSFGWAARKNNRLFLYLKEAVKEVTLYGLTGSVLSAASMAGEPVGVRSCQHGIILDMRQVEFDQAVTVVQIMFDCEIQVVEGLQQQERKQVILPSCCCQVIVRDGREAGAVNFDSALDRVLGEYRAQADRMNVNINGVVEHWFSVENSIQWEFDLKEAGEYEAVLYTITEKYGEWKGKHQVVLNCQGEYHSRCKEQVIRASLEADVIPEGVNRKYFAETGSSLGYLSFQKAGRYCVKLKTDWINPEDKAGLSVSRLELRKSE